MQVACLVLQMAEFGLSVVVSGLGLVAKRDGLSYGAGGSRGASGGQTTRFMTMKTFALGTC